MTTFLIKAAQFILALLLLVLLHELGHFFFSKLFGARVNKFYVFYYWKFSLWKKKIGETEYGVGWIPLGGFCQIDGMVDETQLDKEKLKAPPKPWEFRSKPTWQRLLIMLGGVLVNFFLALFIYSMIMYAWGDSYVATKDMTCGMSFNNEAKAIGFRDGDILLSTDLREFKSFDADLYRDLSKAKECRILRGGKAMTIPMPGDLNLLDMMKASPSFVTPLIPAVVDSVLPEGPAKAAGIMPDDRVLAVGGQTVNSWNEIFDILGHRSDGLIDARTRRDSLDLRTVSVVFRHAEAATADTATIVLTPEMQFGVTVASAVGNYKETHIAYGFWSSFPAGVKYGINVLGGYVGDLKYVFSSDGVKSLGGFGTIGSLFPSVWNWHLFWLMTAFLSIVLAFMNLLPIPALDGGHVLFLLYEMITRRKPSDNFMIGAEYVGFGILILLMVVANLNDILRWIGVM
ncbi:MAG: RIP metalloprotease RseP [Prevotella sp.]|nr:RIP metalloprotease RseP [Prevotella sp.]